MIWGWREFGDWAFFACAFITVLFAVLYLFLAPWWQTVTGRNIMSVMGSIAVAFAYFAWVIHLGGVPGYFWPMRAILFSGIALAIGWRIVIFIREHLRRSLRTSKRKRDEDELENSR